MAAHRYWRLLITANYQNTPGNMLIGDLFLQTFVGTYPTDALSSSNTDARATASSVYNGNTASYGPGAAFRNNGLTNYWMTATDATFPQWIAWDFGAAPKEINCISLGHGTNSSWGPRLPSAGTVQYSDNGTDWTDWFSFADTRAAPVDGVTHLRSYMKPGSHGAASTPKPSPQRHRYWRLANWAPFNYPKSIPAGLSEFELIDHEDGVWPVGRFSVTGWSALPVHTWDAVTGATNRIAQNWADLATSRADGIALYNAAFDGKAQSFTFRGTGPSTVSQATVIPAGTTEWLEFKARSDATHRYLVVRFRQWGGSTSGIRIYVDEALKYSLNGAATSTQQVAVDLGVTEGVRTIRIAYESTGTVSSYQNLNISSVRIGATCGPFGTNGNITNAFDGSSVTAWLPTGTTWPHVIGYDFGVSPIQVAGVRVRAHTTAGYTITNSWVQYSDNGVDWSEWFYFRWPGDTTPIAQEIALINHPAPADPPPPLADPEPAPGAGNLPPVFTSGEMATVIEGTPVSAVVYQAAATDPEGAAVTWALLGADAAMASIDPSGAVRLNEVPDFERKPRYNFTVEASDPEGARATCPVVLNVTDIDDTIFVDGLTIDVLILPAEAVEQPPPPPPYKRRRQTLMM